jgi:calcium-dependent protein kinase
VVSRSGDIRQDYTFQKKLGDGSYGVVYLATKNGSGSGSDSEVAVKQIAKNRIKKPERLINEINVITSCDHPNIVRCYEIYEDPRNIHFATEVCRGGELYDWIIKHGTFNEAVSRRIF